MGQIIGGIFKVIFSPLIKLVMSFLYGILIRGPLTFLNSLDRAFQYVSGSKVDSLIFSTSLVDNNPHLNFFSSDSPLRHLFLIMLLIGGVLLVIFFVIIIIKTISSNKSAVGPLRKASQVFLSLTIVFAIPLLFLTSLSLMGGMMSAINTKNVVVSSKDVTIYKNVTTPIINRLQAGKDSLPILNGVEQKYKVWNKEFSWKTSSKIVKVHKELNLTLEQIYNNLQDKTWVTSEITKSLVAKVKSDLKIVKKFANSYLSDNSLNSLKLILSALKPNEKDESKSDKVQTISNKMSVLSIAIQNWKDDSDDLLDQTGSDSFLAKNIAIHNYFIAYKSILGKPFIGTEKIEGKEILNIFQLQQDLNFLINGTIDNPKASLLTLVNRLTNFQDSSLAVVFYQTATGNKDTNWNSSFVSLHNGGFMLLIGCALIVSACWIMVMAVLWAIMRIFDLSLLFIISPVVVLMSPLDDGQRFKNWMNMTVAKMIGIAGIIISLRLFGMLSGIFSKGLDATQLFAGEKGWMVKLFIKGLFGIGGLIAAYKSSQMISGIVGAGYGIMEGLQTGQVLGLVRKGTRTTGRIASFSGLALGLRRTVEGNSSGGKRLGRIASVKSNWSNRANSVKNVSAKSNNGLARFTKGKVGSHRSKDRLIDIQTIRLNSKKSKMQSRRNNNNFSVRKINSKKRTSDLNAKRMNRQNLERQNKNYKKIDKKGEKKW